MTKKLAVIFLENPPYLSNVSNAVDQGNNENHTYIWDEMKNSGISMTANDLDEQFIWSVFNIYKPYGYIHYGPIRCWKTKHLIDKEVKAAYLCNRKYFNAAEGAIALLYWTGKDKNNKSIKFNSELGVYEIKKIETKAEVLLKKLECNKEDAICAIKSTTFATNFMTGLLTDDTKPKGPGSWYKWISKDNLIYALPVFVASKDDFTISGKNPHTNTVDFRVIETVLKCGDGDLKYTKDTEFLQDCLLWVLCSNSYVCNSNGEFYTTCESLLDDEHKNTEIYKLYKQLVDETGTNGLKNIQHTLGRTNTDINKLKHILSIFQYETIRPKMLEYELLK